MAGRKIGPNGPKADSVTVRLTPEQKARLETATTVGPYRITLTEVVARGIELAARELEQMAAKAS